MGAGGTEWVMPRRARWVETGILHHVTQRGNNREEVFRAETDCEQYLKLALSHGEEAGVEFSGYCLMPNHVHLLVRPLEKESLAVFMRETQSEYSRVFNRRYGRVGHLWQSRYYSCALEGRHGLNAMRYVDRNPVTLGLVERACEWRWSSARAHCGGELDEFGLLNMEWLRWWDWPADWESYVAEGDLEMEAEIRRHTRLGRRMGEIRVRRAKAAKVSVTKGT